VRAVCFSPEADIVAGVFVTAIGIDTLRHVGHDREAAMAALPVIFGLHQLIEVPVWWALEGLVPMAVGRGAAWLYLAIAFGLLPWAVPYAVRRLEVDPMRRNLMSGFVALGVIVAIALMIPILTTPISVLNAGNHLAYSASLFLGGALTVLYVAATCGSLILSSDRVVVIYGWMNLVAVTVLAGLLRSGVISLWCVWAAVTSIAIAIHLRRLHRQHEGRVVLAGV
jgi:hypothetical protein